ncbi:MAG: alpha/beta hydrolase [Marinilabiliaceae bacterium]|nr:alpha/beta hydrolase [Marinilabiliaceae bacterium]
MKKIVFLYLFFLITKMISGQEYMPLWPEGKIPNSKGLTMEYEEAHQRITRVAEPGIYAFFTSNDENKRSAVLICPPGGYAKLSYYSAGFQFAKWLNTIGVNAFVLIHRLPTEPDLIEQEKGPIQDAQRAMKLIRANAFYWKLDTARIGIMGASAGGHLASTLGTHFDDFSTIGDSIDKFSFQPNFMILISPVISMGEFTHKGSRKNFLGEKPKSHLINLYSNELQVSSKTCPAFVIHAQDDPVVNCIGSIIFYQALVKNNIPASLHIFPNGKHSISLRNNPAETNLWTELCERWLMSIGAISKD